MNDKYGAWQSIRDYGSYCDYNDVDIIDYYKLYKDIVNKSKRKQHLKSLLH
jgi:hypothetical protein